MAYIPDDNVETTFDEYCLQEGGLIRSDDMVGSTQTTAIWIEAKFDWVTELLFTGLDSNTHAWSKSLHLQWVNNLTINAHAYPGKTQCHICFYLGIADRLRYIFYVIALHPFVFEDLPGSWMRGTGAPFQEWDAILVNLIGEEKLGTARKENLKKEINLEINRERKKLAEELYEAAIDFLMLHEIQHFWLGHVYGLEIFSKFGMAESGQPKADSATPYTLRRMIETHADIYAARHAFDYIGVLEKQERSTAGTNWFIAVAILFLALEPNPVSYDQWDMQKYAHPHLRLASLFNYVFAINADLELTQEEIDSIYTNFIRVLAKIEVLGKNKLVFPLTEMLNETSKFKEEVTQWIETLKLYTALLHDGQVTMLRYFEELNNA